MHYADTLNGQNEHTVYVKRSYMYELIMLMVIAFIVLVIIIRNLTSETVTDGGASGEIHLYLGRHYRLWLEKARKTAVALDAGSLRVQLPTPTDPQAVAALLETWYRREAQKVFAEELAAAGRRVAPLGIVPPAAVRIRRMSSRWGSCTSRGAITLNLRLIQADRALIEYVLVHELCHLLQHNHSPAYYKLLDRALPDWRARKKRLNAARLP